MTDPGFARCASEILRALRGRRSQLAFARRLGYRANPITDWENGRRFPTVTETLRAARLVGVDAAGAFNRLAPLGDGARAALGSSRGISEWLSSLRGSGTISALAQRAGLSRYTVSRCLAGHTDPRLPDFLCLIDAATGRLHDWVEALVGIDAVPSLGERYGQVIAAHRLALEHPWTEAVLRVLETAGYRRCRQNTASYLAHRLGLERSHVQRLLASLLAAGTLVRRGGKLHVTANLTVDTAAAPAQINRVRQHWAEVGLDRLHRHGPPDWFAYNVIAVSAEDSLRIEQRLRAAYREVRSIVADSRPEEVACLLTIHMVRW